MHDHRAAPRAASPGNHPDREQYQLPQDRDRLLEALFAERLRRGHPVPLFEEGTSALDGNEPATLERLCTLGAMVRLVVVGHGRVTFAQIQSRRRQTVTNRANIIAACWHLGVDVYDREKRPERLVRRGRRRDQARPTGRAPRASTNTRSRGSRRSGSSSSTASADPGEPDDADACSGRFCAGCGRDISHRRADAKTCGSTCRKRVERGEGLEQLLAERDDLWREAARVGGHRALTRTVASDLHDVYRTPRSEAERATTAKRTEVDSLALHRWMMETNGTATRLRRGSPWARPDYALRTRPFGVEAVA